MLATVASCNRNGPCCALVGDGARVDIAAATDIPMRYRTAALPTCCGRRTICAAGPDVADRLPAGCVLSGPRFAERTLWNVGGAALITSCVPLATPKLSQFRCFWKGRYGRGAPAVYEVSIARRS